MVGNYRGVRQPCRDGATLQPGRQLPCAVSPAGSYRAPSVSPAGSYRAAGDAMANYAELPAAVGRAA